MTAPIAEAVSLLARAEPSALAQLRRDHPTEHAILVEGEEAGTDDDGKDTENARIRTAVAIASIGAALKEYHKWFPRLRARLARAQQAMFAGQVMSLVAGASIFTDSAVDFPRGVKIACGLVALAGSIATLYSAHLQRPLGSDGTNLIELYKRLAEAGANAQLLKFQLLAWSAADSVAPHEVIASANETCYTLNQLAPLFIPEDTSAFPQGRGAARQHL